MQALWPLLSQLTEGEFAPCICDKVQELFRADVPVNIYLSGGINSSAIAGIITHLVKEEGITVGTGDITGKVCIFSIAFDEKMDSTKVVRTLKAPACPTWMDGSSCEFWYSNCVTNSFHVIAIAARTLGWVGIWNIKEHTNEREQCVQ